MSSFFGGGTVAPPPPSLSTYDPYSQYRQQAAGQLNNLVNDPSMAMSGPGFSSTMQAGTNAVNTGMAATGGVSSGHQQAALQNLGQNNFNNYYNQMFNQLSSLSGAGQSPAQAATEQYSGVMGQSIQANQVQQQGWNNVMGLVGVGVGAAMGMPGGGGMFSGISSMYSSLFGDNYGNQAQQTASQMGDPTSTVQNYPGV